MISIIKMLFLVSLITTISGCSKWFSVGTEQTYCQENGCNYIDVGVCANPIDILRNKDNLEEFKNEVEDEEYH